MAHREVVPEVIHITDRYATNRAEQSHEATRASGRGMRKFKSVCQAQNWSPPMLLSRIYSILAGTSLALSIIVILGIGACKQ